MPVQCTKYCSDGSRFIRYNDIIPRLRPLTSDIGDKSCWRSLKRQRGRHWLLWFENSRFFMTVEYACFVVRPTWIYKNENFNLRFVKYSEKLKMQCFRKSLCIGQSFAKADTIWFVMKPQWTRALCLVSGFIFSFWTGCKDSVHRGETQLWNVCFVWTWYKYEIWIGKLFDLSAASQLTCHATKRHWPGLPSVMRRGYYGHRLGLKYRSLLIHYD